MKINVAVSKFYDWESLPEHIVPTEKDIDKKLVKPAGRMIDTGKKDDAGEPVFRPAWLMRVKRDQASHTEIHISEDDLMQEILHCAIKDKKIYTRSEVLPIFMARRVMDHHAHRSWMKGFEVDDSSSDPDGFEKLIDTHIACGNLQDEDRADLLKAYATPHTAEHHVTRLHDHFGVKKAVA